MDVGVGLPSTIPGVERESVLEWARRAEQRGFSSLGTIDRIVYPNWEPLATLAAAGAVTSRIKLLTSILLGPVRANNVLLAKQAATVDAVAGGGRLVLGIAPGGREDDFDASGVAFAERGRAFDRQLAEMRQVWAGSNGVGPAADGGVPIIVGGAAKAAVRRTAEHGAGWMAGGSGPEAFKQTAEQVREAWAKAGRQGEPRLMALAYFSLGDGAREQADSYIGDYYAWLGPVAEQIAKAVATTDEMVASYKQAYVDAGCDELVFFPCSTDPEQVDLLAAAAL